MQTATNFVEQPFGDAILCLRAQFPRYVAKKAIASDLIQPVNIGEDSPAVRQWSSVGLGCYV